MADSAKLRRDKYRQNIPEIFAATAGLYYQYWGEFFHFALFEEDDNPEAFEVALEKTHERYFRAINGMQAKHILELACGGGAFSEWMAERTSGEVVGVDISDYQLTRARDRLKRKPRPNLRFTQHDVMQLASLDEAPFDAAVYLDAACYLPNKPAAVRGIARLLRQGAPFLLVDWCRPERVTRLQYEMILEPFYRYWGIPELETLSGYQKAFARAGLDLREVTDLSARVWPDWERSYKLALRALAEINLPEQMLKLANVRIRYGGGAVELAKNQFNAVIFAKAAADAGLIRYMYFLAERA